MGYDPIEKEWELIVKYSGTLEAVRQTARSVTELLNGYAVIVIEEERIGQLAQLPEVEFIEKPKKLYFQTDVGRQVSCIDIVQDMPLLNTTQNKDLTGGSIMKMQSSEMRMEQRGLCLFGISLLMGGLRQDIWQEQSIHGSRSMRR